MNLQTIAFFFISLIQITPWIWAQFYWNWSFRWSWESVETPERLQTVTIISYSVFSLWSKKKHLWILLARNALLFQLHEGQAINNLWGWQLVPSSKINIYILDYFLIPNLNSPLSWKLKSKSMLFNPQGIMHILKKRGKIIKNMQCLEDTFLLLYRTYLNACNAGKVCHKKKGD